MNVTKVKYRSGSHHDLGIEWDAMQVAFCGEVEGVERIVDSFVIARKADGTIIRKVDLLFPLWEIVSDEADLQESQKHFMGRDRLAAEGAQKLEEL